MQQHRKREEREEIVAAAAQHTEQVESRQQLLIVIVIVIDRDTTKKTKKNPIRMGIAAAAGDHGSMSEIHPPAATAQPMPHPPHATHEDCPHSTHPQQAAIIIMLQLLLRHQQPLSCPPPRHQPLPP